MACSAGTIPPALDVLAGSAGGPTSTKSLCMTASRLEPWPCCHERLLGIGRVHQQHVGLAARAEVDRLTGTDCDGLDAARPGCSKAGTSVSSSPVSRVLVVVAMIIRPLGVAVVELAPPDEPDPQAAVVRVAASSTATAQGRRVTSLSFVRRSR